jgi:hypothetical protein
MNGYEDVIAAFLDDERVDATMLQRALALPEGREYLVQVLALRELMNPQGRDGITTPRRAVGWRAGAPRSWERVVRRWAVAAVVLLLASIGGYVIGQRAGFLAHVQGAGSSAEAGGEATAPLAPKPTHLIRLQPGVNWSASGGR